ncbi:uncharacterized protein si:rp71-46j2.7 [Brachionichthys hirsutus]|uniref:uncharacterized protein si:rp71-46j2.7 n=1 Tax=Brachionichthys hirsutus TaxID=412623 RepID=UPI0036049AD1
MRAWRLAVAAALGLAWCCSDWGHAVTQYFLCFLFCFSAPLLFGNCGRESSTQTEEDAKEDALQRTVEEELFADSTDGGHSRAEALGCQYPHVKKSLQKVFECAYAQVILPWYHVSVSCEHQPLYRVLRGEVDYIIDRIIETAKDFNLGQVVVGSIRVLSQHLHNARQSDRELLFTSRAQEVEVLREFSDTLVRNLFPKSLWSQEINRCTLTEVVALKGLGLLVTWLSDPDNLNQLVVSQLDSVTPRSSVEELCGSDPDQVSLASQEGKGSKTSLEEAGISTGTGTKAKRKCNKIKEGWSKFVGKMKSKRAKKKKMKMMERNLMLRVMMRQGDASSEDSDGEGSIHSQQDSDRSSDLESYMTRVQEEMMEFKLSYEMWRVGHWAVSIPHACMENEQLVFTIHLEEKDSPENLQWDIRKAYMDVIHFCNRWQDSTGLPSIMVLEESEVNLQIKEDARVSVERFLQDLVSDDQIGRTQPVFQFLCPLDKLLNEEQHYGGVWGILSGLAYFLTPGHDEDESSIHEAEAPLHPESTTGASTGKGDDVPSAVIPTILISPCGPPPDPPKEAEHEPQSANDDCSQDKTEDSDDPLIQFKMFFRGLSRSKSQDSLALTKNTDDDDPPDSEPVPHCSQNGDLHGESAEGPSWRHFSARAIKKEKMSIKQSGGANKAKGKDQGTLPRGEDSQSQRSQVNWEQLEATKAIFDLLKEISGNSILINIFDAILKPVLPILKKKVNAFLNKMNPTEMQTASLIDSARGKQWPEQPAAAAAAHPPRRTDEEKNETRERAQDLINAKYSHYLILKKTDVEFVFNLFQDRDENKTLAYMLLSFLLREFFPNETSLNVSTAALKKVTNSTN